MKREVREIEVYIYKGTTAYLRHVAHSIDEASDVAYNLEKNSKEEFDGTILCENNKWFGRHTRGTCYILG